MVVHHVEMHPVRAGSQRSGGVFAQPREIGGEDGRGDDRGLLAHD
jgi:hypothetical protein